MKSFKTKSAIFLFLVGLPFLLTAQITTKKVSFVPGKSATSIKGVIKGDQTIDYTVNAKEGQELKVQVILK